MFNDTPGMQEDRVFRCRIEIAYAVIWLAVAGHGSALALASLYVHARTCDWPCAQIFVGMATLHKRVSFLMHTAFPFTAISACTY